MADILLRGFEMPTDASLWLLIKPDGTVFKIKDNDKLGIPKEGVAVHLPAGHGRCIDADVLMSDFIKARWEFFSDGDTFLRLLKQAPTIIPAEGGSEDG